VTIEAERLVRLLVQARVMAAVVVVVLSVLVLMPDRFKLDRWLPFVQVVAFRPIFAAATMILGVVLFRWAWPCAVVLLGVGVLAAVAVLPRSIPSAEPAFSGRELSVLSFNVYNGRVDAAALAQIIRDRSPDLVALPEAGQGFRERLDHELVAQRYTHGAQVQRVNRMSTA
jgi:endonuclease/exonuclease/phosphatase (EEP) superfamily protein YafD